jgi:hypothetical protein
MVAEAQGFVMLHRFLLRRFALRQTHEVTGGRGACPLPPIQIADPCVTEGLTRDASSGLRS